MESHLIFLYKYRSILTLYAAKLTKFLYFCHCDNIYEKHAPLKYVSAYNPRYPIL